MHVPTSDGFDIARILYHPASSALSAKAQAGLSPERVTKGENPVHWALHKWCSVYTSVAQGGGVTRGIFKPRHARGVNYSRFQGTMLSWWPDTGQNAITAPA